MAQIILDSANNLIQGDFDAATVNNRTKLQTSTTNATTGVYVVPNGSATSASVQMANAADPTNASKIVVATNGATDTQIVSGANGSGSYLPLSFYTNNDIRFQMGNTGELNVRTAPGTVSSGTSGQFLTSGGPGAGVSWTTAAGGSIQSELFTSPGTWTKPATVTQVRVTVVGGGGGAAQPGGGSATAGSTSSFGSLVSATGGGAGNNGSAGSPGTGTVTTGTALKTQGAFINTNFTTPTRPGLLASYGIISGSILTTPGGPSVIAAVPYSTSSLFIAGAAGNSSSSGVGGVGGLAIAISPVSAPAAVTVGSGGPGIPAGAGGDSGGVGGAVLVEFVG